MTVTRIALLTHCQALTQACGYTEGMGPWRRLWPMGLWGSGNCTSSGAQLLSVSGGSGHHSTYHRWALSHRHISYGSRGWESMATGSVLGGGSLQACTWGPSSAPVEGPVVLNLFLRGCRPVGSGWPPGPCLTDFSPRDPSPRAAGGQDSHPGIRHIPAEAQDRDVHPGAG